LKKLAIIVVLLSASAFAQIATDDFSAATSGAIIVGTGQGTGNWRRSGYSTGSPYNYNASNQATAQTTVGGVVWGGAGTFTDDQYSQVSLVSSGGSTRRGGVIVRATAGTALANKNFYYFFCSSSSCTLGKWVAGSNTSIATCNSPGTLPVTLRLEAEGTTIRPKINGATPGACSASYTDSSLTTGKPGIMNDNTTANSAVLDDWAGGNIGAQPDPPTISPASGTYYFTAQSISMSGCAGTIYYTTDGSTPTHSSSTYSAPFNSASSGSQSIKAICYTTVDSNVATNTYTISNPSPVTLASDDFSSYFLSEMDAISVPGNPLDTWWTSGRWRSNSTWKLTASRVPSTAFVKAGGAGHGPTTAGDSTVSGIASYSGRSFPNDQFSKGKISGTQDAGVCVRMSTIGEKTGYCFRIARVASDAKLYKYVNEAETTLASPSPGTVNEGDDIEIRVAGSQVFGYLNGSIIATATDSAITSGNPGILAHKEHSRTAAGAAVNPNSGIYSWSAGGFATPTASTVYISEGTIPSSYSDSMTSSWTGLPTNASASFQFPWVSGAAYMPSAGSPANVWGGAIRGYSNAGIGGVGLYNTGQFMSSTTMQYRQPFGDSQWEQIKMTTDSSETGLNNWFLMMKSQLYIPGQADGGCTAAGTAPVCFDHVAYYLGVQTMATSVYISGRSAICQAFQGVKTEYSCTPFLHITKVTPARNDDAVISVVGSLYTPMAGDTIRGEYDHGRLRAYCKNGRTYASWASGTVYTKGQIVLDSNGNIQIVKVAGTSGGSAPSWPTEPEWDPFLEGTTTTDNTVTWMYFGEPCPTTDSWTLVFEVIDTDLDGLGGYPGLFLGGAMNPNGSNAGWDGSEANWPKAVPFFTDWSAGTLGDYGYVPELLSATANVSDTATTSDEADVAPLTAYTKTETVAAADALGRIVRLTKPLADSSTVGDTINIRTPYWVNKADSIGVADALVASRVGATQEKTLVDVMAAAESGNATTINGSGLSGDSSTVSDSLSANKIVGTQSFIRSASETVSASDTLARVAVHPRSASVTVGVGDGLNSETSGSVSQNENTILADTVAVQAIHPNSLADENNVGDVIAVYVTHPTSFKKKVVVIS
jgi:hypothetical protein